MDDRTVATGTPTRTRPWSPWSLEWSIDAGPRRLYIVGPPPAHSSIEITIDQGLELAAALVKAAAAVPGTPTPPRT